MRVLIASSTAERTEQPNDFFSAVHGELLVVSPVLCQNADCGCHFSFLGVTSAPALHGFDGRTTWALVAERDEKDYLRPVKDAIERWRDDEHNGEVVERVLTDLALVSRTLEENGYKVGTVVRVDHGSTGSNIYPDKEEDA